MQAVSSMGLDLQDGPFRVTDLGTLLRGPDSMIVSEELARTDGAVSVFRRYGSRSYTISGTIRENTASALEQAIDQLKLSLLQQKGETVIGWAGGSRYYPSECNNVMISRGASELTRCSYSAQFFMEKPFAHNGTVETLATASAQTTASQQLSTNNIGTYLASPLIEITFTAIEPDDSDVTITIGNPATSEYLAITDTFADGDILEIDLDNKQIFHNGELLNPVGEWPEWTPGSGLLDYSDDADSRTIDINATYQPRYL